MRSSWTPYQPDYSQPATPFSVWDYHTGRWVAPQSESRLSREYRRKQLDDPGGTPLPAFPPRSNTPAERPATKQTEDAMSQPNNAPADPFHPNTQDPLQSLLSTTNDVLRIVDTLRGNQSQNRLTPPVVQPTPETEWYKKPEVLIGVGLLLLVVLLLNR